MLEMNVSCALTLLVAAVPQQEWNMTLVLVCCWRWWDFEPLIVLVVTPPRSSFTAAKIHNGLKFCYPLTPFCPENWPVDKCC